MGSSGCSSTCIYTSMKFVNESWWGKQCRVTVQVCSGVLLCLCTPPPDCKPDCKFPKQGFSVSVEGMSHGGCACKAGWVASHAVIMHLLAGTCRGTMWPAGSGGHDFTL